MPFSDANSDSSPPPVVKMSDADCERVAQQRAHDAAFYIYRDDVENLEEQVYEQTYADCVNVKKRNAR
jgi:ACT domain-containing protein